MVFNGEIAMQYVSRINHLIQSSHSSCITALTCSVIVVIIIIMRNGCWINWFQCHSLNFIIWRISIIAVYKSIHPFKQLFFSAKRISEWSPNWRKIIKIVNRNSPATILKTYFRKKGNNTQDLHLRHRHNLDNYHNASNHRYILRHQINDNWTHFLDTLLILHKYAE